MSILKRKTEAYAGDSSEQTRALCLTAWEYNDAAILVIPYIDGNQHHRYLKLCPISQYLLPYPRFFPCFK